VRRINARERTLFASAVLVAAFCAPLLAYGGFARSSSPFRQWRAGDPMIRVREYSGVTLDGAWPAVWVGGDQHVTVPGRCLE